MVKAALRRVPAWLWWWNSLALPGLLVFALVAARLLLPGADDNCAMSVAGCSTPGALLGLPNEAWVVTTSGLALAVALVVWTVDGLVGIIMILRHWDAASAATRHWLRSWPRLFWLVLAGLAVIGLVSKLLYLW